MSDTRPAKADNSTPPIRFLEGEGPQRDEPEALSPASSAGGILFEPPAAAPGRPREAAASDDRPAEQLGAKPLWRRAWEGLKSAAEWIVGLSCIVVALAVLAAIPVLQLLSFGYLLEVSGRIVRQRRVLAGFIGVKQAARVGFLAAHTWLMFVPLRLLTDVWHDAQLIDPLGAAAGNLRVAQLVLMALTLAHVLSAWHCGGKARHFYWPLLAPWHLFRTIFGRRRWRDWFPPARLLADARSGGAYRRARDGVWDFVQGLQVSYFFRLGAFGLLGAAIWLAVPVALLAGAAALPQVPAVLAGLLGGVLLAAVAVRLPFMEANYAASGEWRQLMDRRLAGRQCARAPLAFWFALLLCLALAIPLHLIQAAPPLLPELRWLLNLLFVILLLPARFAAGWAVSRAERRETPRFVGSRWASRLGAVPVALFYALVVYLSQFINYYGSWRLLEQPAFMLPAPFWLIG